jgi:Ca-activated chloride channel homolog
LASALRAAKTVVQNLRREDNLALITFDDAASVVIPMGPVSSKQAVLDRIDGIQSGSSTNLTGGWRLGRDDLRGTPIGTARRQLLLTDGVLNIGITEPTLVSRSSPTGWSVTAFAPAPFTSNSEEHGAASRQHLGTDRE